MSRTGQLIDYGLAEALCEYYLPRVFQYVRYWIEDTEMAEEISLKTLRHSMLKANNLCAKTDAASVEIFNLVRKCLNRQTKMSDGILSALSSEEREVMSLKLGGELSNHCIAAILKLPEPRVGELVYRSLCKLKGV